MMSLADEIDRLGAQRDAGRLTDAEFESAKARLLSHDAPTGSGPGGVSVDQLRRSMSDRWVGGVCGGIARLTGVESWIVRLLVVATILFAGFGLIPYFLLWIFVPPER